MIQAHALTKRYDGRAVVEDLSFTVQPGLVTGFLGPNGAGKSTTMRMIMGLDAPSSGTVTVNGRPFAEHERPLATVGALLEAKAVHTSRTARNHLLALAATAGIGRRRVDEVLDLVGLAPVAGKRAGSFSLGMSQRLGIASALLADPDVLILDEPVNGLDPDGVRWIRTLLRDLAAEGRTVFLSSHLMSEMALTADHIVCIAQGRLLRDQPTAEFIAEASASTVRVRSPHADRLARLLAAPDVTVRPVADDTLEVDGLTSERIGEAAAASGVVLWELVPESASLEEAYMALTQEATTYRSTGQAGTETAA